MLFGEFSGDAGEALRAQIVFEQAKGFREAVGGFVPDEGTFFGLELLEVGVVAFSGEKAFKSEAMRG
jgi:hypothetical protein